MSFFFVMITGAGVQELARDCFLTPPTSLKDGGNIEGPEGTAGTTWTVEPTGTVETLWIWEPLFLNREINRIGGALRTEGPRLLDY